MAIRENFTDEEWKGIKDQLGMVALYIATVGKTGPVQMIKEIAAASKVVASAQDSPDPLIAALVADLKERDDSDKIAKPDAASGTEQLREDIVKQSAAALAAIREKAPESAEVYKSLLLEIARAAAEGAKEGSFMGIGGTKVTEEETAAIAELTAALA